MNGTIEPGAVGARPTGKGSTLDAFQREMNARLSAEMEARLEKDRIKRKRYQAKKDARLKQEMLNRLPAAKPHGGMIYVPVPGWYVMRSDGQRVMIGSYLGEGA